MDATDPEIRDATPEDASFIAWVLQASARSHVPLSFWDLAFPGPDSWRLDQLTRLTVMEPISFAHHGGFIVAELDGRPAAALSAYDSAEKGMDGFLGVLEALLVEREWSKEHRDLMGERIAPIGACMPDSPPGVWTIEWVAALPEARGKGLARALLLEILERGRAAGYESSQISYLIGNTPAVTAYERVGFETVSEKRDETFERIFGSPGIATMTRKL